MEKIEDKIIKIDFSKDKIFGFENPKSIEVINSLILAIRHDIDLPLINVFKIGKNQYSLCPKTKITVKGENFIDGGHHRAIAFYKEKGYMNVKLIEKPILPVHSLQQGHIDVSKIKIENNDDEYKKRIKRYGNYL